MDKKLIEAYGTEILSYRLRTARQKKRAQYEDFDKHLRKLHRRDRALDEQWANRGWEPLTPPVQVGWKRFFVLRDDVARSKHAAFFEGILKKINTYDWSHRKDFKVKYRRFGRKQYRVKLQTLLRPREDQFKKLGFSEAEKQFFHEEWRFKNNELTKYYVFNEPWRFVLRVRPNMINQVRRAVPELESEMHYIRTYLEWNNYKPRYDKVIYGYVWRYWKWECKCSNSTNVLKNKSVQQVLDVIKQDEE